MSGRDNSKSFDDIAESIFAAFERSSEDGEQFDINQLNMDDQTAVYETVIDDQVDESDWDGESSGIEKTAVDKVGGTAKPDTESEKPDDKPSQADYDQDGDIDDGITTRNIMNLIHAEIKRKGFAGHHIESMNEFYRNGIRQILTQVFTIEGRVKNTRDKTEEDREIEYITFLVEITDIRLSKPVATKYSSGKPEILLPNMAVLKRLTLSCPMEVDITVTAVAHYRNGTKLTRTGVVKNHKIGSMICMEKSDMDHTTNLSRASLFELGEDPNSIGGSMIIRGGRWAVVSLESMTYNKFHVHYNNHMGEVVRGEFISKPGDGFENSTYMVMRLMNTGAITLQLTTSKKERLEVPFYLIFRAMGVMSDMEIVDHIVYGVDNTDEISMKMMQTLQRAFTVADSKFKAIQRSRDRDEILYFLALKLNESANNLQARKDENVTKYLVNNVLNVIDRFIFPHIGTTPADRMRKLRFIGHLIGIMLRVEMGVCAPTDRDSYRSKRIFAAGAALSKVFKKDVNVTVVVELKRHLTREFTSGPFSKVDLEKAVRQAINVQDLERVMTRTITDGSGLVTVRRAQIANRISSQTLYPKNDMNVKSIMSTIDTPSTTSAKSTDRADEMRRGHPTHLGFIDPSQSADTGEKVGMTKQKACTTSVSKATNSYLIKQMLLRDEQIIPLDNVMPRQIAAEALAKVFVNGDWIGCCHNAWNICAKYRRMRRTGQMHHTVTIVCDVQVRELYFWADIGRLLRPLICVYNNYEAYCDAARAGKPIQFKQWIKLTRAHLDGISAGTVTIDDLRIAGVIEYISPEEQENAFLAPNIVELRQAQHDLTHMYTHCDIDQAIFGIVTLASPLGNHSNSVRNTMYTNHRKQAAGWFVLNYANTMVKNTTFQHYSQFPLVSTMADSLTLPNGANCMVLIGCHTGDNQEDSAVANRHSIDRGLFNQTHYNYELTELDKDEMFGDIDLARTLDVKKGADYTKCVGGFVREKQIVRKGTVLVVKVAKIPKPTDQFTYVDKSVIYNQSEDVFVDTVITAHDEDGKFMCKVKYSAFRPIMVGDKLSSREGNKGIEAKQLDAADMPYDEQGVTPDLIINCHSLPTRMAVNQIIEGLLGLLAVTTGKFIDATAFQPVDIDSAIEQLAQHGIKHAGHTQMYCGTTGEPIDTLMFFVPNVYQQLQKFVMDEHYAIQNGPTQALTRQPLEGRAYDGGLRLGEMETNVKEGHGCGMGLYSKLFDDSDGMVINLCRECGRRAVVNERRHLYTCTNCGPIMQPVRVHSSWTANVLWNELETASVGVRLMTEPITFSE
jgi:DNA-directed RNA polymerase beta subunit